MGDRVAVLKDGLLAQCDTPLNLYQKPANVFVAGFIGSPGMNIAEFRVDDGEAVHGQARVRLATPTLTALRDEGADRVVDRLPARGPRHRRRRRAGVVPRRRRRRRGARVRRLPLRHADGRAGHVRSSAEWIRASRRPRATASTCASARGTSTTSRPAPASVFPHEPRQGQKQRREGAMTELVAGVDSSTQSCKVVIRDAGVGRAGPTGSCRASRRHRGAPGRLVGRAAGRRSTTPAGSTTCGRLAVGAQQHGMVCLDESGEVVRPALLWNDTRSAGAATDLIDELGGGEAGRRAWADAVGTVPVASFTVTKLRWLADHEPDAAKRTAAVALPHDWLSWRLTGEPGAGADLERSSPTAATRAAPATGRPPTSQYRPRPARPRARPRRRRPARARAGRAGRQDARRRRARARNRRQRGGGPGARSPAGRRRGLDRHVRGRVLA